MPDDIKEEVTEQEETGDEGFSGGFQDDEAQTKGDEAGDKDEKTEAGDKKEVAEDKKEEPPAKKDVKSEAKDKGGEKAKAKAGEKEEPGAEEDEVDLRGKQLLDEEKKAEEDAKKLKESAEAKEKETAASARKEVSAPPPFTEELAKVFLDLAKPDNLPKTIKLGDTELELQDFVGANPEFSVLAGMQATNIIQRLVDQGILMTSDSHNAAIAKVLETVDLRLFDMAVRQHVSNPDEIWDSKEFQEYHAKAPDSFKALFRSKDPRDHVNGFRKYLGKATEKVREKMSEVDAEAAKKKKVHDDIHSHTLRSGKTRPDAEHTSTDVDEEFSEGFRDQA